jgi:tetratricopeptide (TPR) repeat protein
VVDYCDQALQLIDSGAVDSDGVVRGGVLEHKAHALGWVHRYEESDRLMHEAIAEFDRAGGTGHSFAAEGRRQLGSNYMWSGRRAEASALLAESLSMMERAKGPDDRELTAHVRTSYATNLFLRGELAAAEPHMLHAWRNLQGPETALLPHTQINLLRLRTQQGRFREAREFGAGVDERTERIFGKGSWMHTTALVRLGELALAEGRNGEARANFSRVLEIVDEAPDAMTNNPAAARLGLLQLALSESRATAAVEQARILLADIENSKGRHDMPDESAAGHLLLGLALLRTGDAAGARPHFETAVSMREKMDAPQSLWLAEARLYRALGLHALGDPGAARALLVQAERAHATQGQVGPQFSRLLAHVRTTLDR